MGNRMLLAFVASVSLTAGCINQAISPTDTSKTAPIGHSMKGYELYSWKVDGQWHFTLTVGTNRIKTLDEIVSPNSTAFGESGATVAVVGVDAIKTALGRLPAGEEIFWLDGRRLGSSQAGTDALVFPPDDIIADITIRCGQLGLSLHVNR